MMIRVNFICDSFMKLLSILLVLFLLFGCSGGGGSSDETITATGSSTSVGTITGFGSVFVNGVRYDTSSATIIRDGLQVSESDLDLGMIVSVSRSSGNNSMAERVEFDEDIKGIVDMNDNSGTLSIMGQTVIANASTVFIDGALNTLTPGTVAEVSGFRDANDSLIATFIENKGAPASVNSYEVTGNVRNLDAVAMTFQIDDLLVSYASANLNDFDGGVPAEGQRVEVKDELKTYITNSLSINATKVEPQPGLVSGSPGDEIEIESIVTQVNSPTSFVIAGKTVTTSNSTLYLFGDADQIAVGVKLEVEGRLNSSGNLAASKIKFEDNDSRISGQVFAKGVNTLTMLNAAGVVVTVSDQTQIENDTTNGPLDFAGIMVNDYLEIRGFIGANGAFIATEIERDDLDSDASIRGVVTAFDSVARTVTVLGQTLNTNVTTQYQVINDQVVTADAFFNSLTSGLTIVEGKWDPFNNIVDSVKELEVED